MATLLATDAISVSAFSVCSVLLLSYCTKKNWVRFGPPKHFFQAPPLVATEIALVTHRLQLKFSRYQLEFLTYVANE
jgi:hypothetical protein